MKTRNQIVQEGNQENSSIFQSETSSRVQYTLIRETQKSTLSTRQNPPKSPLIRGTGRRAFTLVELIIVITILAILATIAFMSFQGYSEQTRDSNRLTTLKSIEKGLTLFQTNSGVYPETSSGITIIASGTTIGYQGTVGENVVRVINMNQVPLDPVDNSRYVYATNEAKTKYQLMAFMEGEDNLVGYVLPTYAGDLSERTPQSIGDNVGIVLNTDNSLPTLLEINVSSGTSNYKVVFGNSDEVTASGNIVFSQIYNMREDLMNKKELASLDESLVGYWDMETLTGNLLRDRSKYENHGTCYDSGTVVDCGGSDGGPQFVDGVSGKSMKFDGLDDWIFSGRDSLSLPYFTIFIKLKQDETDFPEKYWVPILSNASGSNIYRNYSLWYNNTSQYYHYTYGNGIIQRTMNVRGEYSDASTIVMVKNVHSFLGYFNGNQKFSFDSDEEAINGNSNFMLGSINQTSPLYGKFKGTIDEVRIYSRALSDSEIKALYNATK